jgi:hypothetical protein
MGKKNVCASESKSENYGALFSHIENLPSVSILTTGRTGSDLLNSLLDSHPQVLTLTTHFLVYSEFFNNSICFNAKNPRASDIADEFIGKYIYKLSTIYDIQEGMDRLGIEYNESLTISSHDFKSHFLEFLSQRPLTTKNILIAIYGSYNLCLGRDIAASKILVLHPHLRHELRLLCNDFPNTSAIFTVRDPRANFVSLIINFRNYYRQNDNQQHVYGALETILDDANIARELKLKHIAMRIEDMLNPDSMQSLAQWIGIDFSDSLLESTWGGLEWHGDRLSKKLFSSKGWSANRTSNNWQNDLSLKDKFLIEFLTCQIISQYDYKKIKITFSSFLIAFILIPFPLKFECRFLTPHYIYNTIRSKDKNLIFEALLTPWFYYKRVRLCYKQLLKICSNNFQKTLYIKKNE